MKNSSKTIMAVMAAAVLTLALMAPSAFAQSSQDGYIQEGPSVVDRTDGAGGDEPSGSSPGSDSGSGSSGGSNDELPFTGLDLGLVAVAGASFMLLGFGMRRLTRSPDSV